MVAEDGTARLPGGQTVALPMTLAAGTLNVFRGKNTAHKVGTVKGGRERVQQFAIIKMCFTCKK